MLLLSAGVLAALGGGDAMGGGPEPTAAAREEARLRHENTLLEQQIAAAETRDFCLVLDPPGRALRMTLAGVVLREFTVERMQIGARQGFSCSGPALPTGWERQTWAGGALVPPRARTRAEIVVDSDSLVAPPDLPIPPTPEEAYPVPARFWVRYQGGLSLEVLYAGLPGDTLSRAAETSFRQRLATRVRHLLDDAFGPRTDELRLRLTLPPRDAAILYRCLPEETKLILLFPAAD